MFKLLSHSRESGNPVQIGFQLWQDPRFRGDDVLHGVDVLRGVDVLHGVDVLRGDDVLRGVDVLK
jgi:hypothetical protein